MTIDTEQLGAAWSQLKEVVFGNEVPDSVHGSFEHDAPGFFAETTFPLAQKRIGSRLESLAQEEVNRAVLGHEGVDSFNLEQHTEDGLLLEKPVRGFNAAAAMYLKQRLDDADIKLGDLIPSAARAYYSNQLIHLIQIESEVNGLFEAAEKDLVLTAHTVATEGNVYLGPNLGRPDEEQCFELSSGIDFFSSSIGISNIFPQYIFPFCDLALSILVAGSAELDHKDYFRYPLLTSSNIGLMMALGHDGLIRRKIIWEFLTKLGVAPKDSDKLTVL